MKIFFFLWGAEWKETTFPFIEFLATCENRFQKYFLNDF